MNKDSLFQYFVDNRTSLSQQIFKEKGKFKQYKRFPQILLPQAAPVEASFSDLLARRSSVREYADKALTLQQLSTFLFWSAGLLEEKNESGAHKRTHPSGGGKYPLELYLLILREGELKRGVYHYNIQTHALEHLMVVDIDALLACFPAYHAFALESSMIVLYSFMKNRSMEKYGALAYKLAFIESGHIGQTMYLLAPALGLGCCGMGMNDGLTLADTLGLDSFQEGVLYAMAVGIPR